MSQQLKKVEILSIRIDINSVEQQLDDVVVEKSLKIYVNERFITTLMCLEESLEALTVGFLLSNGFIKEKLEVRSLEFDQAHEAVFVDLESEAAAVDEGHFLGSSGAYFADTMACNSQLPKLLRLPAEKLVQIMEQLISRQTIFKKTGATHAAGIFNQACELLAFNEDIGRHNALDKVIGHCVMNQISLQGCGVVLSSRVSYEMTLKALKAGLEMIVAVSAPTAKAIELAKNHQMTLCGFVRTTRANIYCGEERILGKE